MGLELNLKKRYFKKVVFDLDHWSRNGCCLQYSPFMMLKKSPGCCFLMSATSRATLFLYTLLVFLMLLITSNQRTTIIDQSESHLVSMFISSAPMVMAAASCFPSPEPQLSTKGIFSSTLDSREQPHFSVSPSPFSLDFGTLDFRLGLDNSEDDGQLTRDRHVSRVQDHAHWFPGEILTILHVSHFTVAQSSQKLAKNVAHDT